MTPTDIPGEEDDDASALLFINEWLGAIVDSGERELFYI